MPFSFAARCGGDFRFAPSVAGTCGSPTYTPSLFVIPYSLRSKRTAPATGRGLEPNCAPGFFSLPQICAPVPADPNLPGSKKAPGRVPSFGLYHRLPQDSPSRIRAAERHTKTIHSSLFSIHLSRPGLPLPLPGSAREPPSAGAEDQFPGSNAGLQNALSPRTAPHVGHRFILNPCRKAAHRNYSLFTLLYSLSQPCPFSLRIGQQNKNIFCFLVT